MFHRQYVWMEHWTQRHSNHLKNSLFYRGTIHEYTTVQYCVLKQQKRQSFFKDQRSKDRRGPLSYQPSCVLVVCTRKYVCVLCIEDFSGENAKYKCTCTFTLAIN